jgi:hypothetical protein
LIGHNPPNKPANGMGIAGRWTDRQGPHSAQGGNDKKEHQMFQGFINFETAEPVDVSAIQDVLFERGMHWSSGRSGIVDLVAAHKWFNLAALKGRKDAVTLRQEVAGQMSDADISAAQREARAWVSAH